jgi:hypothetical protein
MFNGEAETPMRTNNVVRLFELKPAKGKLSRGTLKSVPDDAASGHNTNRSGFGVGTRSKVIELRRSYTALKINPNQIARALHRKRARNVILGISARPT